MEDPTSTTAATVHRDPGTLLRLVHAAGFDTVEHGLNTAGRTWLSVLAIKREV
ncbi:hypothetical protein [Nonomuraea sp. B5E05]|uniref:hypothetical protein n=1 Tax=Nonomuraea sp. B5E05 TaxID=3153569 RepID=UPI0032612CE9